MPLYKETVEWMFQQLPMYQRVGATAFRKDLKNIQLFSAELEDPHNTFNTVHVAGTNGKGSTSHMIASVLQEAGYKVGLYTSPHLKDFRERIKVNGIEIPEEKVISFITANKDFLQTHKLSFFEMSVGMAFQHFREEKVDIAVVEVGMGGRLDSTNIITPVLSVITNIGFDHMQFLGDSLAEIAYEKAGIIKEGVPVVIGEIQNETQEVFKKVAEERNSKIIFAEDSVQEKYSCGLKGDYQEKNIKTVVSAIRHIRKINFEISEVQLNKGLQNVISNTGLRGRWEILGENPKVICDTAHNAEGLRYVLKQLTKEEYTKLHVVIGVVNDKDLSKILPLFPGDAIYFFCKPDVPRGMDAGELMEKALEFGLNGKAYPSVYKAYKQALKTASKADLIFIGGSTFTVAEII